MTSKPSNLIPGSVNVRPIQVVDVRTGEIVPLGEHDELVNKVLNWVRDETARMFEVHKTQLCDVLKNEKSKFQSSIARQNGWKSSALDLPRHVLVKSRLDRLVAHKLVTETASWVRNPQENKQPPTFSAKINLGVTDSHMVTLSYSGSKLTLVWKCWDRHLLIEFYVPEYVTQRNITKWCLPVVYVNRRTGLLTYTFAWQETAKDRDPGNHVAGVDLGRVLPYAAAVLNEQGARVAHYTASARLTQVNQKRESILVEKTHTWRKHDAHKRLGNIERADLLKQKARELGAKASRLGVEVGRQTGAELVQKLTKHRLHLVAVEDLEWVSGTKKSTKTKNRGSKWAHSQTQDKMSHALAREGITTKKVHAAYTSQTCPTCGGKITHNTRTRTAKCKTCATPPVDRDVLASMNIALRLLRSRQNSYPASHRTRRDNPTPTGEVVEPQVHNSHLQELQLE